MIINLESQTDLSGFYIVYKGSTNLETKGIRGISHLSEHLFCKAYEHLQTEFERKGITWNAYTSSDEIVFYFTGLSEYLKPYRNVVLDLLKSFRPTEEQFKDEIRIVIEEYKTYFANQGYSHFLNVNRKKFNYYDPIGSLVDLQNLKYSDIISFIEKQYSAPSKIINVSKEDNFSYETDFTNIDTSIKLEFGDYEYEPELGNSFKDKSSIIMMTKIFDNNISGYIEFISMMIGNGLQSPLYKEIREKRGLTYGISCGSYNVGDNNYAYIMTDTSNDKTEEMLETLKNTLNDSNILTQERFDIIKERILIKKKMSEINRYLNVSQWINDKQSILDIVEEVTLERLKEIYNEFFIFEKMYPSVDKVEFMD
jgi:predicted Zn-dependent peptidase